MTSHAQFAFVEQDSVAAPQWGRQRSNLGRYYLRTEIVPLCCVSGWVFRREVRDGVSVSGPGLASVGWCEVRVFGELETVVMDQLWSLGGTATVREVFERLNADRVIAYTTVLSTMDNLYRKGHLTRERVGKAHRYQTVLTHVEHTAGLMHEALSTGEDSEAVLTHFVGTMSDDELARLYQVMKNRPGTSA